MPFSMPIGLYLKRKKKRKEMIAGYTYHSKLVISLQITFFHSVPFFPSYPI
uniref:Uncharacterized protein LOC103953712 n=1 Tax=Rhizophora mucronata TaxID=61149 RepID=A0A2P2JJF5_RHIMU